MGYVAGELGKGPVLLGAPGPSQGSDLSSHGSVPPGAAHTHPLASQGQHVLPRGPVPAEDGGSILKVTHKHRHDVQKHRHFDFNKL